ncbi:MAG TPA: aminopeptidase [Burkholderiales bacterium]|nr:aminopeptidase [Burkholderiales bacterium]
MKRIIVVLAAVLLIVGCSSMQYYMQAMSGHLDVMSRSRPIDEVLAEQKTSDALRKKLQHVQTIRSFASRELGLPDNGSYRGYADINRPYVVWNVFAAPDVSLEARKSCFIFVGCVAYRGYYSLSEAEDFAAELRAEGYDTYIGGVPAYSTLGFFEDPILNTFVAYPDAELARLIFHELAHQQVFLKGDTTFNESFAVAVEREGLRRWLAHAGTEADRKAYAFYTDRREGFLKLVMGYRSKLDQLYRSKVSKAEKLEGKQSLYAHMQSDYQRLKLSWNGYSGYDRFFADANNATLVSLAAYTQMVPAFEALLEREGYDLNRFYVAARDLSRLDKSERDTQLATLLKSVLGAHVASTQELRAVAP